MNTKSNITLLINLSPALYYYYLLIKTRTKLSQDVQWTSPNSIDSIEQ